MTLPNNKSILILTLLLHFQFPLFSQTTTKIDNITHVYGLLNKDIVFCDTAMVEIDPETFVTKEPGFVIKNLSSGRSVVLVHDKLEMPSSKVFIKDNFLIVKYGVERQYEKYIVKVNENGEVVKEFGVNGFVLLPNIKEEILEFIDLAYDSYGNLYVLEELNLSNGLKQAIIYKFNTIGVLDFNFGDRGVLLSPSISEYSSLFKLSLHKNQLALTCSNNLENKTGLVFTIKDNGKSIQKTEKVLGDFLFLESISENIILVIKRTGVDIYDKELSIISSIKDISNDMLTTLHYNEINNKIYIIVDGLSFKTSKIYELQNDFSTLLLFSAENYSEYALSKDDHITGIKFLKGEIVIALSITESFEKYTYVNYLIQL